MGNRFPRELRLAKRQDIDRVFHSGRSVSCPGLRLVWIENHRDFNRIVISPTRRFPTAVRRNRVRRVLRETFRINVHRLVSGYDIAAVVYPGNYSGGERSNQLLRLLSSAGLITDIQRSES